MTRLSSKMKEKKKGASEEAHVAVQLLTGIILVIGVGALLWLVAAGALRRAAAGALSCEAPTWLTVFELNATAGCPGDWRYHHMH